MKTIWLGLETEKKIGGDKSETIRSNKRVR